MDRRIRLSLKIIILVSVLIITLVAMISFASYSLIARETLDRVGENCMNVAKTVSMSPKVIEALGHMDSDGLLQIHVEEIRSQLKNIEYIVVCDMNHIRLTHPDGEKIGKEAVGDDRNQAIKGISIITQDVGTLGPAVRSFAPIYQSGEQIGYVAVGMLTVDIQKIQNRYLSIILGVSFICAFIGLLGAILLSRNIKKSIFGLEPYEIARLYTEKRSMLEGMREGIIAIDVNDKITMVNQSAIDILKLDHQRKEDLIGMDINSVFPQNRLSQVVKSNQAEINMRENLNGAVILVNRLPVLNMGKIIGAIATFTDKTQMMQLAEELTGIKQLTDGLRAKNHEFQNKVHIILGLLNREKYKELKEYVTEIANIEDDINLNLSKKIKNSKLEALLIGKFSRARELGIEIKLFEDTFIDHTSHDMDTALITIVGNLLENSLEELEKQNGVDKKVLLGIIEDETSIQIIVNDNGLGLEDDHLKSIFEKGFSTKGKGRGTGLYLVKREADAFNGEIEVNSTLGEGTYFHVTLDKEKNND